MVHCVCVCVCVFCVGVFENKTCRSSTWLKVGVDGGLKKHNATIVLLRMPRALSLLLALCAAAALSSAAASADETECLKQG